MSRAQTISEYAVWLAVMVDTSTDGRAGLAQEPAPDMLAVDAGDARPDLIPHPAHRILHRALRPAR
jgi:hypothetical protein